MGAQQQELQGLIKALVPFMLGILGVVLLALPMRLFGGLVPTPIFPIAIIFYWSLKNDRYLPPIAAFGTGLFHDLIFGGALGVWTSIYVFIQYLVSGQREYFLGRDPHVIWTGFLLACIVAAGLLWVLTSLLNGEWAVMRGLLVQFSVTVLAFPLLSVFFSRVHRRIIVE